MPRTKTGCVTDHAEARVTAPIETAANGAALSADLARRRGFLVLCAARRLRCRLAVCSLLDRRLSRTTPAHHLQLHSNMWRQPEPCEVRSSRAYSSQKTSLDSSARGGLDRRRHQRLGLPLLARQAQWRRRGAVPARFGVGRTSVVAQRIKECSCREAVSVESREKRSAHSRTRHLIRENRRFCRVGRSAGYPGSPEPVEVSEAARTRRRCENYAYLVPFAEEAERFFLKTVIPSRKATRDFLNQGHTDAEH